MSDAYGNIIPQRYILPNKPAKYDQQVIVNWLQVEVPQQKPLPMLKWLTRWRNKEVFFFIRYEFGDWTAKCFR